MLVVSKDFNQQVGGTFLSFKAGKVLVDQGLEAELLRTKAPVVEVQHSADLVQCPHCRRQFTLRQAVAAED